MLLNDKLVELIGCKLEDKLDADIIIISILPLNIFTKVIKTIIKCQIMYPTNTTD